MKSSEFNLDQLHVLRVQTERALNRLERQHRSMIDKGMPADDPLLIATGECVEAERRRHQVINGLMFQRRRALGLPIEFAASKNPTGKKGPRREEEVRMNRAGVKVVKR